MEATETMSRVRFTAPQPPAGVYEIGACGARCQALVLGTPPEGRAELAAAHRAIYGPERTDVKVPLGPEECPPPPRERKG